ncbi:MAG TPA: maleylpyruvate isomerase family mycothiol-dependent enzyme [Egicoccus sp.]|nr:maleylpyruvate isomerase family mycothiol-dependent enzyme [Egicoccus sp.]HSK22644.1 maleylpyruvate isomerase family mycothiol-dependent enzyme [Egicoccus sp.]
MDTTAYLDVVQAEAHAFADNLGQVAADAPVPTCPGWLVRDLAAHLGNVHRRITRYVLEQRRERLPAGPAGNPAAVDPAELATWLRTGADHLVASLRAAPADLDCYVLFTGAPPRQMWSRRMAHETAIHGIDLASAAGRARRVEVAFAADGIDEVLTGIARPGHCPTSPAPFTTLVAPFEVEDRWTVDVGDADHYCVRRTGEDADLRLSGPAASLYRLLWNRGGVDDIDVDGDAGLLAHWRAWHV